jgi:hypothetical protein
MKPTWRLSFKVYDEFGDIVVKTGKLPFNDGLNSLFDVIDKKVGYQIRKGWTNLFKK